MATGNLDAAGEELVARSCTHSKDMGWMATWENGRARWRKDRISIACVSKPLVVFNTAMGGAVTMSHKTWQPDKSYFGLCNGDKKIASAFSREKVNSSPGLTTWRVAGILQCNM